MIETIQAINWETVGLTLLGIVGTINGARIWLNRNIVNVKQLKEDGADLSTQVKYYKAMIKDNDSLRTEISNSKIEMRTMTKKFGQLVKKKDDEIAELKKDMRELIKVVKESVE